MWAISRRNGQRLAKKGWGVYGVFLSRGGDPVYLVYRKKKGGMVSLKKNTHISRTKKKRRKTEYHRVIDA